MRLTDAAFEGAVERYGDTVFRLAYSYLKNRADAEDVMQETLLKLYLERKPFRSPEHERYWVVRVAVNESKNLSVGAAQSVVLAQVPMGGTERIPLTETLGRVLAEAVAL